MLLEKGKVLTKNIEKSPFAARILIILLAFLSIGALASGAMLMLAPDGSLLGMPVSVMQGAPFENFLIPGFILFTFLGVYPAVIVYGLWKKPAWNWPNLFNPFKKMHWSWAGLLAAAAIVFIWLTVELIWVDFSILHTIYYVLCVLILIFSMTMPVRRYLKKI